MRAKSLSFKGSSQRSWISNPKVKGGGHLLSTGAHLFQGSVNDTTPNSDTDLSTGQAGVSTN